MSALRALALTARLWLWRRDLDCEPCPRQLEGTLPDVLAQLTALQRLELCGNSLRGTLPAAWGADGAFLELQVGM